MKEFFECIKFGFLHYWCYEKQKHYKCSYFKHLLINLNYAMWLIRNKNKHMQTQNPSIKEMTADQELASKAAPLAEYLKENHHPHTRAIVTSEGVEIVEGVNNIHDIFGTLAEYFKPEETL